MLNNAYVNTGSLQILSDGRPATESEYPSLISYSRGPDIGAYSYFRFSTHQDIQRLHSTL